MTQNSYDLNNSIRDVSSIFDTLIANSPSLLGRLGSISQSLDELTGAPLLAPKNHKYEWVDDIMLQTRSAITSFDVDGDGTGVNVASTAGLEAGSIIRFESAAGASKTELARVVSVDSTTDLTIARDYGSTTGVTLTVGDIVVLVATPRNEQSNVGAATLHQGTVNYNYTQIFDAVASLSRTAMATSTYDNASQMNYQIKAAMIRLSRNIEEAIINGVRVQRTSSDALNGTLGGVLSFVGAAGGNIDATGGAISLTLINNVVENIIANGGDISNLIVLCSPNQARKISALNTTGSNPTVFKDISDRTLGGYTSALVGDLPVLGRGALLDVFMAHSMLKDQIAILDLNKINLRVMTGLQIKDATLPGTDGITQRLLTELTLEVKNSTKAHGLLTGLTL